jgi:hypothetical protein
MKFVMLAMILLTGCTITVKPLPPVTAKKVVHHVAHHVAEKPSSKGTVVDATWVSEYKKMEAQHAHTIPQDTWINTTQSGKFWVPAAVVEHYQDLIRTPSPSPTPTPSETPIP